MRDSYQSKSEQGATLVYFSMILIVLMGFVALAVDLGYFYSERRQMQNAADAAAIAGAWALCNNQAWNAESTAETYALENGAESVDVSIDEWKVEVTAGKTIDTFFAGVLGVNDITVTAEAEASCGQTDSTCNLWPVAFNLSDWEALQEQSCGSVFYLWAGDRDIEDIDCEEYDCDLNDDGVDDVITSVDRAWLDFSNQVTEEYPDFCAQPGWGANELRCELLNGSGARISAPTCIDGDHGLKAGVSKAVEARSGDYVPIALFDDYCSGGWFSGHKQFRVVSFGCVQILGWTQSLELSCKEEEHDDHECHDEDHDGHDDHDHHECDSEHDEHECHDEDHDGHDDHDHHECSSDDHHDSENDDSSSHDSNKGRRDKGFMSESKGRDDRESHDDHEGHGDHDDHGDHCRPIRTKAIIAAISCDPTACFTSCGGVTGEPPVPGGVSAVGLTK